MINMGENIWEEKGEVKGEIKREVLKTGDTLGMPFEVAMIGMNLDGGTVIAETTATGKKVGSGPTDGATDYDPRTTKKVKLTLLETDEDCRWAYEHDDATYTAVRKRTAMINTGFRGRVADKYNDDKKVNDIMPKFKKEVSNVLKPKVDSIVINQDVHAFCILKKNYNKDNKLIGCIELDPIECKPIRDLSTGELGGKLGLGKDISRPNEEIALVQEGHTISYNSHGEGTEVDAWFYFTRDEIIPFSLNDRGRFKGVSPVMRMLRSVEVRRTIINITELVLRRFGPQIIVTVGNKDVNLNGDEIPASYLRDSSNEPVDRATAKANYRAAVMTSVKTQIKDWADTDTLVHIQEYGYSVETINPSSVLPDYIRFINEFGRQIKNGILGIFVEGRVDVTSSAMQENVNKDLKDSALDRRDDIIHRLNEEYVNEWLKDNGLEENSIYLEFNPIDKTSEQAEAITQRTISETIRNFASAGYEIPDNILKKLGIDKLEENNRKPVGPQQKGTQGQPVGGQLPSGAGKS